MDLIAFGLNHQTAPLAVRERMVFSDPTIPPALHELMTCGAREAAILSTCNRTEIYCRPTHSQIEPLVAWLCHRSGLPRQEIATSLYQYPNAAAVKHTFRVACGLDSQVLGEPQILGQMKRAYATAADSGTTGKVLNRLFHHTFRTAKQIRTDTAIGANAVSVAYCGVHLARQIFTHLSDQRVLLIGAGDTIELAAVHLKRQQVRAIVIANRTRAHAHTLATAVGGEAIGLAEIPKRLAEADIVVTSTASPLPILGKGAVEAALKTRRYKPMLILDLAVPRDVEPAVRQLNEVYLYTVDDLREVVDDNYAKRRRAADQAEGLIDYQVLQFMRWLRAQRAVPTVKAIKSALMAMSLTERVRAEKKLANGGDPHQILAQFATALANKFAHHPIQAIKQAQSHAAREDDDNDNGDDHGDEETELAAAARRLFNVRD